MSQSRDERIESLLLDALELDGGERQAFLEAECGGDEDLLEAVLRRLEALRRVEAALGSPQAFDRPQTGVGAGTRLGEFELLGEIGRGGMGVVFRARQHSLQRDVAVKVLPPALASARLRLERFRREAFAVSKLQHPGVVPILSFGVADDVVYYAMEFVEGPSLAEVVRAARRGEVLDGVGELAGQPRRVARLVSELLRAVQHIHQRGVLHRDIKPHNVLLGPSCAPRLIDFGLAKDLELADLTRTGDTAGTPNYMSPEQARSTRHPVDERTDVYSVGALLYELLTLQPPFAGVSLPQLFIKIATEEPTAPRRLAKHIPRDLEVICLKALAKEPDERYTSAAAMADDLVRYLEGDPIHARRPSVVTRVKKAALKRRALLKVAPLILVVGGLGGAWIWRERALVADRADWPTVTLSWAEEGRVRIYSRRLGPEVCTFSEPHLIAEAGQGSWTGRVEPAEQRLVIVSESGGFAEVRPTLRRGEEGAWRLRLAHPGEVSGELVLVKGEAISTTLQSTGPRGPVFDATVPVDSFYLDRATVTRGEFRDYLIESGRDQDPRWTQWLDRTRSDEDWDLPATWVSWFEAQDFAVWQGKRLPTAAEWELAMAQGIDEWAESREPADKQKLNLLDDADASKGVDDEVRRPALDWLRPSRDEQAIFGESEFYHPLGNVEEWTESPDIGPSPEVVGALRIARGASYRQSRSRWLERRSSACGLRPPQGGSGDLGFRCAKTAYNPLGYR